MEQKQGLMRSSTRLPGFVEDAYASVDQMQKFSKLLLESKLVPDHFYEKGPDNKPDYAKGKVPAVMMVLLQGYQLDLPPMTALQHIIPVNGLLSIKGDAAKTLISSSGLLESWKEDITGSVASGDYKVSITAKRKDTNETMTRSFSIENAKRAGLWIDDAKIRGNDGWKYKKSAWYKFPERMIGYRALGFLARDLFPDVLSGIYTTEEAMDMPQETETVIDTNGVNITIPDKEFNQERSNKLTKNAIKDIDKHFTVSATTGVIPSEKTETDVPVYDTVTETEPDSAPLRPGDFLKKYSMEDLTLMSTKNLLELINDNADMTEALTIIPGRNTNKKLRTIVFAKQEGKLEEHVSFYKNKAQAQGDLQVTEDDLPPEEKKQTDSTDDEELEAMEAIQQEETPKQQEEKEFPLTSAPVVIGGNKFNIEIPQLPEGSDTRDFDAVKSLYEAFSDIAGIDNRGFQGIINSSFPEFKRFRTKEQFCREATVEEIHILLNSIE